MSRRPAGEQGAVAVELALLLPLLLLVVAGVIDLGNALRAEVQLQDAVQDGAVFASRYPGDPALVRQRVTESSAGLTPLAVTVSCSGTSPVVVTVRASHVHSWLLGLLRAGTWTMTADVRADVVAATSCVSG
jgi:Flp pilus assembly protein TadG